MKIPRDSTRFLTRIDLANPNKLVPVKNQKKKKLNNKVYF